MATSKSQNLSNSKSSHGTKKPKGIETDQIFSSFQIISAIIIFLIAFTLAVYFLSYQTFESPELNSVVSSKLSSANTSQSETVKCTEPNTSIKLLKYWPICLEKWNPNDNLRSMNRAFEKLNFIKSDKSDWDIVWSIEGPRVSPYDKIQKFKNHQKVNHFPFNSILVTKVYMNYYNRHSKYILPSFMLPEDKKALDIFIHGNPDKKFVRKNFFNRGVEIIEVKDINNDDPDEFFQVFLDKPLLIEGHAFDMGVFVLITSVDPLRIYKYDHEILLRFCEKEYYPFDSKDTSKYVVQEGHISTYEMKTFGDDYRKYSATSKDIFERHLRQRGYNVSKMQEQIDDAIVSIVRTAEPIISDDIKNTSHAHHNFFELVRFDFMVDEDLNVYVMEVNMSPNMTPAEKRFEANALIYEPMIYSAIQMIGGASYHEFHSRFSNDTTIVNSKNLVTDIDTCISNDCENSCHKSRCKLCLPCLNSNQLFQMKESFREWRYQGEFVRVFPKSIHFENDKLYSRSSDNNRFMMKWFDSMCKKNLRWC